MPTDLLISSLAGVLTWTILEYWIHRYLGHQHRKNIFATEHLRHHAEGNYFAPALKKVAGAVVVSVGLGVPASLVAGTAIGWSYALSLVAAWLVYEWIHWFAHVHPGFTAYGHWVRRHHFSHHFHYPKACFGVTSPVWDVVFGTWRRPPEVIRVPEQRAMRWLQGHGDALPPHLARHWEIKPSPKRSTA